MFDWLDRDAVAALSPGRTPEYFAGLGYGFAVPMFDNGARLCFGSALEGDGAAIWWEHGDGESRVVFEDESIALAWHVFTSRVHDLKLSAVSS